MAGADYYSCDVCGGKAFYDAELHYEPVQPPVSYGCGQKLGYVGDMAVICDECAKTHTVAILSATPIAQPVAAPVVREPLTWQPIESAPKDGSHIMLGNKYGAWIAKYLPVYQSGYRPDNPWQSMMLNCDHMAPRQAGDHVPTHWQPLTPPAPTGASHG